MKGCLWGLIDLSSLNKHRWYVGEEKAGVRGGHTERRLTIYLERRSALALALTCNLNASSQGRTSPAQPHQYLPSQQSPGASWTQHLGISSETTPSPISLGPPALCRYLVLNLNKSSKNLKKLTHYLWEQIPVGTECKGGIPSAHCRVQCCFIDVVLLL